VGGGERKKVKLSDKHLSRGGKDIDKWYSGEGEREKPPPGKEVPGMNKGGEA